MFKLFYLMVCLSFLGFQVEDVEAQRGDPRGGDVRDPRGGDTRDPRAAGEAAPAADPRAGGNSLSKSERVQACKKQYGKGRKNKAAKQACIEAAKR